MASVTSSPRVLPPKSSRDGAVTLLAGLWHGAQDKNQRALKENDSTVILEGH